MYLLHIQKLLTLFFSLLCLKQNYRLRPSTSTPRFPTHHPISRRERHEYTAPTTYNKVLIIIITYIIYDAYNISLLKLLLRDFNKRRRFIRLLPVIMLSLMLFTQSDSYNNPTSSPIHPSVFSCLCGSVLRRCESFQPTS